MKLLRRVIIESPYAAGRGFEIEDNIAYARKCVRDRVLKGDAPIASHLLFTQEGILHDGNPEERKLGIEAGLAWTAHACCSIFFTDHGWSSGMLNALSRCIDNNYFFELRKFDKKWILPSLTQNELDVWVRARCRED